MQIVHGMPNPIFFGKDKKYLNDLSCTESARGMVSVIGHVNPCHAE